MSTNPLTEDSTEVGTWHTAKLRGTMKGEGMTTTKETKDQGSVLSRPQAHILNTRDTSVDCVIFRKR